MLRALAPLTGSRPGLSISRREHLGQALAADAKTVADMGRWNRTTLYRMGDAHQIRVSGQTLTGTQVAGVDSLIEVKIKGRVCTRRPSPRRRGPSSTFLWTREAEQRRAGGRIVAYRDR